jgi:hypothetical protein
LSVAVDRVTARGCAPSRCGYPVPPCAAGADPSQFSACFFSLQRGVGNVDCAWPNGCPVCFRHWHVLVTANWRVVTVSVHCDTLTPSLTAPRPGTPVPYSKSSRAGVLQVELSTTSRTSGVPVCYYLKNSLALSRPGAPRRVHSGWQPQN